MCASRVREVPRLAMIDSVVAVVLTAYQGPSPVTTLGAIVRMLHREDLSGLLWLVCRITPTPRSGATRGAATRASR